MPEIIQSHLIHPVGELPDRTADELDAGADKLGNYTLAEIRLGLRPPFPATHELPSPSRHKSKGPARIPSGHVRFTEPGAADNNLAMDYGMTEHLTPDQIAANRAGLRLFREALAAAAANAASAPEIEPSAETKAEDTARTVQPTLFD